MIRLLRRTALFIFVVFIAPALATIAWWAASDRPHSWSAADWSSSGTLPRADEDGEAAIYLMAARTGGLKGALAVHSWIVWKEPGAREYTRYDKLGWGSPVRRNHRPADGRWYSNTPQIVHAVTGPDAARLIPRFQRAIESYPYAMNGDYRLWPGPNSNSFIAHLLREVPEFGATMPPNATGRDFAPGPLAIDWTVDGRDLHVTFGGFAGLAIGANSGFELHFLGLVAGIDPSRPALKIPALGLVPLWPGL